MAKFVESPSDPGIPTLAAVLDPAVLARQLSPLSLHEWRWDTSQAIRVRVLRWKKASRCTFEIALKTPSGWQELIGKVHAEGRSDIFHAMKTIRQAGFDSEEGFAIPRPVAFLKPLRLLLYEKVPGTRAMEFIQNPTGSSDVLAAERCAKWLARFQAIGPRLGRVYRVDNHLDSLFQWSRSLVDLGSPFAGRATRLFEQLKAAAQGLGTIELRPGHGTYTPSQVLLDEGRTVTIDWDTYEVSDPWRDVARFLVEVKRSALKHLGSIDAYDRANEAFLQAYVSAARSDLTPRLAFHEAAICLERAQHDVEKQSRDWSQKAEAMLDEGLRILEHEATR